MTSEGFHEPIDRLQPKTLDHHRAIASLMEEFEAVDWYDQRVDATDDAELAEVLAHNRDEEKEHAAMTLEWLRRRDPILDEHLRTYLFTEGNILAIEEAAESGDGDGDDGASSPADSGSSTSGSLGIGSLRHLAHNATPAIGGLL
ncbi:MAG: ferritin [Acidimicrobiales bacterium]|nr:ferritin [Acidimicrobiales bacterium]